MAQQHNEKKGSMGWIRTRGVIGKLQEAAARAAGRQKRDVAPAKAVRAEPTPEQRRKARYELQPVTEHSQVVGRVYRREPWFETLWKRNDLTTEQVKALRHYRNAFEASQRSETRCALDVSVGGGTGDGRQFDDLRLAEIFTVYELSVMPGLLRTLRAVALEDKRYSDVAIERWGSRKQRWIDVKASDPAAQHVERIVPKSGRHREIIKTEFVTAVGQMTAGVSQIMRLE